jgi:hypothetical protein
MVERIAVDLTGGRLGMLGAVYRYEVLDRVYRSAQKRGVGFLAFGFAERELRLVVEGTADEVRSVLRGIKVGTVRSASRWGLPLRAGPTRRYHVKDLVQGVAWAHAGPVEAGAPHPLASPWCSHRDLLGFRRANFYDASVLRGRVDVQQLCTIVAARQRPNRVVREREDLTELLRVASAAIGVLPGDRRCFRLFVHLAKARGWPTIAVADALAVTARRVRQLANEIEERLPLALAALQDPLACRVP